GSPPTRPAAGRQTAPRPPGPLPATPPPTRAVRSTATASRAASTLGDGLFGEAVVDAIGERHFARQKAVAEKRAAQPVEARLGQHRVHPPYALFPVARQSPRQHAAVERR